MLGNVLPSLGDGQTSIDHPADLTTIPSHYSHRYMYYRGADVTLPLARAVMVEAVAVGFWRLLHKDRAKQA